MSSTEWRMYVDVIGLVMMTVITRSFFFLSERTPKVPGWLDQGLRYAPLGALSAVVFPEVFMSQGQLIHDWKDARLFAVMTAVIWAKFLGGMLGTIVSGMFVYVALRLALGW